MNLCDDKWSPNTLILRIEETMSTKPSGLIPAVHTPFDSAGQLDLHVVPQQAEYLMRSGCQGIYVGGTTGECHSLTCDERIALADAWLDISDSTDLCVIVHVGDNCMPQAQAMAAHAQGRGADAIAVMAPCFFRPTSIDQLLSYLQEVSSAAPDTPCYFYDIPIMTHVELSMVELLERARTELPNLAGLKYTNDNLMDLQRILRVDPERYNILFGFDEIMSSAWAYGVRGAVGSTYNHFAKLYYAIIAAFEANEPARVRELQNLSVDIIQVLRKYNFGPAAKELMKLCGVNCGTVRSPLQPLAAGELDQLASDLDALDAMQWTS